MLRFGLFALAQRLNTCFSHSVSDIRDDIMSPRTVTNTNLTSAAYTEISEIDKPYPPQ